MQMPTLSSHTRFPVSRPPYAPFEGKRVLAVLSAKDPQFKLSEFLPASLLPVPATDSGPHQPAKLHDFTPLPSQLYKSSRVQDMAKLLLHHLEHTWATSLSKHGLALWILDTETIHVIEVRTHVPELTKGRTTLGPARWNRAYSRRSGGGRGEQVVLLKIARGQMKTIGLADVPNNHADGVFPFLGLFHVKKGLLENFFKHEVRAVRMPGPVLPPCPEPAHPGGPH